MSHRKIFDELFEDKMTPPAVERVNTFTSKDNEKPVTDGIVKLWAKLKNGLADVVQENYYGPTSHPMK